MFFFWVMKTTQEGLVDSAALRPNSLPPLGIKTGEALKARGAVSQYIIIAPPDNTGDKAGSFSVWITLIRRCLHINGANHM